MRSSDCGITERLIETCAKVHIGEKDEILSVFRNMCRIRYFELQVKYAFDTGGMKKMPIYLSVGQESVTSALAAVYKEPYIFAQHRGHDVYLAYGGDERALADELLQRSTGCAGGMGGSASIHSPKISMFGHDGHMGTQVPISVGFALGLQKKGEGKVLSIMGDASAEEDYVLGAMGYAARKQLPVLFVCMDNGLSILTEVSVRRNWNMVDVARAFGMPAIEITDDPWLIMWHAFLMQGQLPAFINIHTVRHLWHNGTGCDGPPEWDRFAMTKETMKSLGYGKEIRAIEKETKRHMELLWETAIKEVPA